MNVWLRYRKWMAGLCFLGLSLTAAAQVKTAEMEQLRKDMYRLFNKHDSLMITGSVLLITYQDK